MNLVTGATGIVGSHVMLELLQRHQPVVACRQADSDISRVEKLFSYYTPEHRRLFEKITWVEVDIRDIFSIEAALQGISTVYHCAGLVSFLKKDRKRLFDINEQGTANVVNACLSRGIGALCHVSSIATVNNTDYILPLNESVFWKKSGHENDYAISKYNGERQVWRGIEEGLNAVIVNPGVILSPGFWEQSSSRLFGASYKGNRFYTEGMSAYIAARDVARIMVELTEKRLFANRYILIENNYSFHQVLDLIHGHLQKPLPSIQAPKTLLRLAAFFSSFFAFFSGKDPAVTPSLIAAAFNRQLFSNAKVQQALDYRFTPVNEAIQEICRHYLQEKASSS